MIDYEGIALSALARIETAPERRAREFNNLVTTMQAEIADLRQWGCQRRRLRSVCEIGPKCTLTSSEGQASKVEFPRCVRNVSLISVSEMAFTCSMLNLAPGK